MISFAWKSGGVRACVYVRNPVTQFNHYFSRTEDVGPTEKHLYATRHPAAHMPSIFIYDDD